MKRGFPGEAAAFRFFCGIRVSSAANPWLNEPDGSFHPRSARHPETALRQGARSLRPRRRRLPARGDRPAFGLRLHPARPHPAQRRGAHAAFGVLVPPSAQPGQHRRPPRDGAISRIFPERLQPFADAARRPLDDRAARPAAAGGMRRARVSGRFGLEGIPGNRQRLRAPAAAGPAPGRSAARADLHPRHARRKAATTKTSTGRAFASCWAATRTWPWRCARRAC